MILGVAMVVDLRFLVWVLFNVGFVWLLLLLVSGLFCLLLWFGFDCVFALWTWGWLVVVVVGFGLD